MRKTRLVKTLLIAVFAFALLGCASSDEKKSSSLNIGFVLDAKEVNALLREQLDKADIRSIALEQQFSDYIRGKVDHFGTPETSVYLAAKKEGEWKIVFLGKGDIPCSLIEPYNFPHDIAYDCK